MKAFAQRVASKVPLCYSTREPQALGNLSTQASRGYGTVFQSTPPAGAATTLWRDLYKRFENETGKGNRRILCASDFNPKQARVANRFRPADSPVWRDCHGPRPRALSQPAVRSCRRNSRGPVDSPVCGWKGGEKGTV